METFIGTDSEPADSGVESSDESPDEDTMAAIVKQVEHLFSDANLRNDVFLMKHIKRNRDGYVSLKLIASLRRVKALARNWKDVACAIRQLSRELLVNEECSKVRRQAALPLDMLIASRAKRIVLLHGLSHACASSLTQSFSVYGNIRSVRPLALESDLDCVLRLYPDMSPTTAALIEFESASEAETAVTRVDRELTSWRQPLSAVLFGHPLPRLCTSAGRCAQTSWAARTRSHTWVSDAGARAEALKRPKAGSCNGFDSANVRQGRPRTPLVRQPLGPDGTRGFRQKRL